MSLNTVPTYTNSERTVNVFTDIRAKYPC